jgi:transposase InsO family protein
VLICDRDAKWSRAVRARLQDAGIRVVQTPHRAPNANAYAERFVRSIKEECLTRTTPEQRDRIQFSVSAQARDTTPFA